MKSQQQQTNKQHTSRQVTKSFPQQDGVRKGFGERFQDLAGEKLQRLGKTILADFKYKPQNQYTFKQKEKIFKYLSMKYLTIAAQAEDYKVKKFTTYDPACGTKIEFKSLQHMKEILMKMKTNRQAAQDALQQLKQSRNLMKANFLNELAYQFDKQRYCSIAWGLIFGAFICSTVYARGRLPRQTALFLTSGHAFGQISYHYNIDKYFDSVYNIFEEDAIQYQQEQARKGNMVERKKIKGGSSIED